MVPSTVGNGLASISPETRPEQAEIGQIDKACLFNFISFYRAFTRAVPQFPGQRVISRVISNFQANDLSSHFRANAH
jgi:hypothetical protein